MPGTAGLAQVSIDWGRKKVSIRTIATFAVADSPWPYCSRPARPQGPEFAAEHGKSLGISATGQTVPVVVADRPIARGRGDRGAKSEGGGFSRRRRSGRQFPKHRANHGDSRPASRMSTIVANEPVLADKISGPGGKLNMSAEVATGMRAISIRSNDVAGVGGFVLPGDRVDVLLTRTLGGGEATAAGATTVTQVLAENVRVLGVDQSDNNEADKPVVTKAVTLEVTPEQAQSISLGGTVGTVSLSLRHVADEVPLARQATTVADLGFGTHRAVVHHSGGGSVRVIRGVETTMFSYSAEHGLVGAEKPEAAAPAAMAAHTP